MSIVTCKHRVQNSSLKQQGAARTYTEEFHIVTNSPDDNAGDIYLGMESASPHPVPQLYTTYATHLGTAYDTGVFLQSREISRLTNRDDDRKNWLVKCTWSPPQSGSGTSPQSRPQENPLLRPTRYSLEWATYTKYIEKDINGNPLENTAGDLFDPYEIDDARPVLVATKNVSNLLTIIQQAIAYKNAINSDVFYGAAPHYAKIESISSGELQSENGIDFYTVTYRVQFVDPNDPVGWDYRTVNEGPQCLDTGGNKIRVRVLDGDNKGQFLDKAYLNAGGQQLPDADPAILVPLTGNDPWQLFPAKPFGALGI